MARFSPGVNAPSAPIPGASTARPACAASARPETDRSTSVQPVNRFSTFQVLWPWRTRMSLAGTLVRELAHRLHADRQRGEVARARGAHVRERTLPERQVLAGRFHPGGDARLGGAALLARQHHLRQSPVDPPRRIAQRGAGDRLPRALDRQLLDTRAQPVKADAFPAFEINPRGPGDPAAMRARDL